MNKCIACQGELKSELTTYTVDIGANVVVIRNVPAEVCEQCGETYYSTDVMRRIYALTEPYAQPNAKTQAETVAVMNYSPAA